MATKLPYLNVLEVESVNKDEVSRAIVIDRDECVKALDIEQITTYQGLSDKPKVNGVELNGDVSLDELNVASKNDLNKVISDVEEIIEDLPTSENIQDKIDDSLMDYPTKSEVTTEINNSIANKADKSEIPTKVSQLENDEGYLTTIPSEYVTETELTNKNYATEQWVENKGYLTSVPETYITEDELNNKNYATKTEVEGKQNQLISGTNIKTINGESILGEGNIKIEDAPDLSNYYNKTESDNKYQLKGDYITPNNINTYLDPITQDITELETSKQETFQVNQPLEFSRSGENLVLDVNLDDYVTDNELEAKQDTLVSGTNIKTINGESILGEGDLVVGGSGSSDYNDLTNKPSIGLITLEGNLTTDQLNLAKLTEFVELEDKVNDNMPYYLKCGTSTIISGNFENVYNAIKNNKNYRIELMLVNAGSTSSSYFGQPEVVKLEGDNIVCFASIHYAGEYVRSTWTISSTGVTVTSSNFNLVETETYSGSIPQVERMITLTQAEYDQLSEYDDNALYIIV